MAYIVVGIFVAMIVALVVAIRLVSTNIFAETDKKNSDL